MTALDDTRYCPMCEDAAKKILELEHRVKVLTDAATQYRNMQKSARVDLDLLCDYADELDDVLNQTPQQTAAQIERGHVEWMMKLPVAGWSSDWKSNAGKLHEECDSLLGFEIPLVAIPPLPKESKE